MHTQALHSSNLNNHPPRSKCPGAVLLLRVHLHARDNRKRQRLTTSCAGCHCAGWQQHMDQWTLLSSVDSSSCACVLLLPAPAHCDCSCNDCSCSTTLVRAQSRRRINKERRYEGHSLAGALQQLLQQLRWVQLTGLTCGNSNDGKEKSGRKCKEQNAQPFALLNSSNSADGHSLFKT
jgi:hypothetical protein